MRKQSKRVGAGVFAILIGMAGGKAQAATADSTGDYLVAGFENNPLSTDLWGYWYFYSDNNVATAIDTVKGNSSLISFPSGSPLYDTVGNYDTASFPLGRAAEAETRSLRFAYTLGDRKLSCGDSCTYPGFVGMGMAFTTQGDGYLDLSTATSISFWARSDSDTVMTEVSVITLDDPPNGAYSQLFSVGPQWKKYTIKLVASAQFKQPTWVKQQPFNPKVAKGLAFAVSRSYAQNEKHPTNAIRIDDVTLDAWPFVDPAAIRAPLRSAGSRQGWRMKIQGSQISIIRDGERVPLNLNGRAILPR